MYVYIYNPYTHTHTLSGMRKKTILRPKKDYKNSVRDYYMQLMATNLKI